MCRSRSEESLLNKNNKSAKENIRLIDTLNSLINKLQAELIRITSQKEQDFNALSNSLENEAEDCLLAVLNHHAPHPVSETSQKFELAKTTFFNTYHLELNLENLQAIREKKFIESNHTSTLGIDISDLFIPESLMESIIDPPLNSLLITNQTFEISTEIAIIGLKTIIQKCQKEIDKLSSLLCNDLSELQEACLDYLSHLDEEIQTYLESLPLNILKDLHKESIKHRRDNKDSADHIEIDTLNDDSTTYLICYHTIIQFNENEPSKLTSMKLPLFNKLKEVTSILFEINQTNTRIIQANSEGFNPETLIKFMRKMQAITSNDHPTKKTLSSHRGALNRFFRRDENSSEGGKCIARLKKIADTYPAEQKTLNLSNIL